MKILSQSIRLQLLAWMINVAVPLLNMFRPLKVWPYTLDELKDFPAKSLGVETAAFLARRNFDFLPQYETHDAIHTLLEYGTTTTGELRLQAFMWGNQSASFAGRVLLVLGVITLPELWMQLRQDYKRGYQAQHLGSLDITGLLKEDLQELRQQFELIPLI
ncbi:MAG: hypothetical protein AAF485_22475 [Chloroflexota bacterium]